MSMEKLKQEADKHIRSLRAGCDKAMENPVHPETAAFVEASMALALWTLVILVGTVLERTTPLIHSPSGRVDA